jgi:hypothetical protein
LSARGAAYLSHRLRRVVEAVNERLGELPAVRVRHEPAVRPDEPSSRDEGAALAAPAEAVVLERDDHERREEVVEERRVDVGGPDTGHLPELARRQ